MQDIVVSILAIAAVAVLVVRFVRSRRKPTGACAACTTEPVDAPKPAGEAEVKPLAFFGGASRKTSKTQRM